MAVKQVRVSDLSGRQADEDQFAKLIVHEHPQYRGPITLDVLPEELMILVGLWIAEHSSAEREVANDTMKLSEAEGRRR